jgi:DNA-binding transcriptional regulator of glucitol operon
MEVPLHHGEFVVSGSRVAADLNISVEQVCSFGKSLLGNTQIRQFQQRFGQAGVGAQGLLKQRFSGSVVSLPLLDITDVK